MNIRKLKAAMVLADKNSNDMAESIGISLSSWNNKISGATEFNIKEANGIKDILSLSCDEVIDIFFAN